MSDKPVPPLPAGISQDLWEKVAGGDCLAADVNTLISTLRQNYDTLVDFTSYVFDQVLGQP